jgi:hypothetical protein
VICESCLRLEHWLLDFHCCPQEISNIVEISYGSHKLYRKEFCTSQCKVVDSVIFFVI